MCDNFGDHLKGNVYVKYADEEMASKAAREGQLRAEELRLLRAEVEQLPPDLSG